MNSRFAKSHVVVDRQHYNTFEITNYFNVINLLELIYFSDRKIRV